MSFLPYVRLEWYMLGWVNGDLWRRTVTRIGVPRESADGERRVALVPKVVERLTGLGLDIVVETDAGGGALIPDVAFENAGARIGDPWQADVVVKVAPPSAEEIGRMRKDAVLIGCLAPRSDPDG